MLELKNVTKVYPAGGENVHALKGIDLTFRENEFVSILGPSGCGKTTLLNIIGGLDQYTSGDLVINGTSTKEFKDRDWDAYRNHAIGFVFQSYNLIPHQTALRNVELALTLSGVGKLKRSKLAKEALEKVGLGDQLRKKPSEMSGGQMQRVAIARAIVNNPDIILADETTGALDTETSIQDMNILKEIAKDRLVIMVTHNPDLAETYSTRIINILDGKITGDSHPLTSEEITREREQGAIRDKEAKKKKRPSMSFHTAFGLSMKNLFTKKGRTALTSFAGSIGIIGIALIYAVSQGMTAYIDTVQEDALSSYPLTIESQNMDTSSLMETFIGKARSESEHENDAVYQKGMIYEMMNALSDMEAQENDLQAFKAYLEAERSDPDSALSQAVSGVQYTYDTDLLIYTKNVDGNIIHSDTRALMQDIISDYVGMDLSAMSAMRDQAMMSTSASMMQSQVKLWHELLPGDNGRLVSPLIEKQYDLLYGSWPTEYNEIVLFLDENNELNDLTLYALGLKSRDDIDAILEAAENKTALDYTQQSWPYEEICDMDFRTILSSDCYAYDETEGVYTDLRDTAAGLQYLYDNGLNLKVVGVARPGEDTVSTRTNGFIGYTSELTEYIIAQAEQSDAVKAQMDDPGTDIFTGLPFRDAGENLNEAQKAADFRAYLESLDESGKADTYVAIMGVPSEDMVRETVDQTLAGMTREKMVETMAQAMSAQMGMDEAAIQSYAASMSDEDMTELFSQMIEEQVREQYATQVQAQLGTMTTQQLAGALVLAAAEYTDEECAAYYDEILEFSDSTYEDNLMTLGKVDMDSPASISLYASTFADKERIEDAIDEYNETVDDMQEIGYTDVVGLMMSSVTTIINAITYVLIAFVAVSLIVSSIMIGVITLISVQERTKEIGILRAIGASKKNVSSMFNAETVIIGFASGVLGVGITWLLCIPVNAVLHHVTGINNLSAFLPPVVAAVLIVISMLLTLIAGIIPSRSAAKKDPVVALRTE